MRKFKHKKTGKIYITGDTGYYKNSEIVYSPNLPHWVIESSNDWEEIVEKQPLFTTEDAIKQIDKLINILNTLK